MSSLSSASASDPRESVTSPLTTFIISVRRLSRSEIASASSIGTTFRSCSSSAIKCVLTRSLLKITSSRSADCPNKRCRASSPATKKTGPITGAKSITAARILPPVRFPGSSLQCCSFHRTYAAVMHRFSTTSSRKYVSILLIVPSPLSSCTESLRS